MEIITIKSGAAAAAAAVASDPKRRMKKSTSSSFPGRIFLKGETKLWEEDDVTMDCYFHTYKGGDY